MYAYISIENQFTSYDSSHIEMIKICSAFFDNATRTFRYWTL